MCDLIPMPEKRRKLNESNKDPNNGSRPYVLDEQIGFLLRQVVQRHLVIFMDQMVGNLTPTQFAALAKLYERGPCSQNRLGRQTAMDAATIKGVIDRLTKQGLTEVKSESEDARLLTVALTKKGRKMVEAAIPIAFQISERTLKPLIQKKRT
ncbi:MAG: putative transcriptional regulatory protein MarR family, partial [Acidobacteriaceae bacterium]|nr:putative transcriptional regulatory protein MarR family [Acidobacteriaceae bacterium]